MAEGAAITREKRIDPQILTQGERLKLEARRQGRDLKIKRARTGMEITPVIERLDAHLVKKLAAAKSKEEFDKLLAGVHVELAQKGRGLIFRDLDDYANQCKASAVSRSLSAASLARRFGGAEGQGSPSGRGGKDKVLEVRSTILESGAAHPIALLDRARALRRKLKAARSLEEFKKILAGAGLEYAARGNGCVIRDRATGESVKATDVDRTFSRKRLDKLFAGSVPARPAAQSGILPDPRGRRGRRVFRTMAWIITVPQLIRRAEKRGDHVSVTAERILVNGNARTGTVWDCARAAAQRFGNGYRVFGTRDFQLRMMKAAAALGHTPHFDDPLVQREFNEILRNRSIENERKNQLARDLALARAREFQRRSQGPARQPGQPAAMDVPVPDLRAMHDGPVGGDEAGRSRGGRAENPAAACAGAGARTGGAIAGTDHRDALHDDLARVVDRGAGAGQRQSGPAGEKPGRLGADAAAAMHGMDERRGGGGGRDLSLKAAAPPAPDSHMHGLENLSNLDHQSHKPQPAISPSPTVILKK